MCLNLCHREYVIQINFLFLVDEHKSNSRNQSIIFIFELILSWSKSTKKWINTDKSIVFSYELNLNNDGVDYWSLLVSFDCSSLIVTFTILAAIFVVTYKCLYRALMYFIYIHILCLYLLLLCFRSTNRIIIEQQQNESKMRGVVTSWFFLIDHRNKAWLYQTIDIMQRQN